MAGSSPYEGQDEVEIIRLKAGLPQEAFHHLGRRITDPTLLSTTGGIVQGMSGSPIVQDGKLVGAVTHVFVNDPTRGYGIFAENMLGTCQSVLGEVETTVA